MALCVADSLISSKIGVHTHLTGIASADARVHVCGHLYVCDVMSKRECVSATHVYEWAAVQRSGQRRLC